MRALCMIALAGLSPLSAGSTGASLSGTVVDPLAIGKYTLEIERPGGSTSESVAVTERPSLLDTRSSEGNQLIEAKRCWTTATGYSQQSSLRVQQELWGGMLFEVAYIANLSKKQPSSILPINQIRLEMMQARSGQAQRPFTQF